MTIMIGADPEFFLWDRDENMYVSAHGIVPGTKDKPYKIDGGAVQVDGTAIEFNVDPSKTALEFEYNINRVILKIRDMVPEKLEFKYVPSVTYKQEYWKKKIPDDCKILGCDPDFNAKIKQYKPNPAPHIDNRSTTRTGAGHIHIGWRKTGDLNDMDFFWDCRMLALEFDRIYKQIKEIWDKDNKREYMYGNGPVFRPKKYGIEIRQPSNAWLNYPLLYGFLFELCKSLLENLKKGVTLKDEVKKYFTSFDFNSYKYIYVEPTEGYNKLAKDFNLPLFPYEPKEIASW